MTEPNINYSLHPKKSGHPLGANETLMSLYDLRGYPAQQQNTGMSIDSSTRHGIILVQCTTNMYITSCHERHHARGSLSSQSLPKHQAYWQYETQYFLCTVYAMVHDAAGLST